MLENTHNEGRNPHHHHTIVSAQLGLIGTRGSNKKRWTEEQQETQNITIKACACS